MLTERKLKILLACGKNQYGDQKLGIGTEYAAFLPTFRRLGFMVNHFETWERYINSNFAELNTELISYVKDSKPDILFFIPLHFELWLETLDAIRDLGVVTICWTTDDSWKYFVVSKYIGSHFDLITTTYPHILPLYRHDLISRVMLTQWAADSSSLNSPLPAKKCVHSVTFIGAAHGNRLERVSNLQKRGIEVKCFGNGWENGPVDAAEIPQIMRNSVISLNFANSKGENQIKARTFEVPGAGGFLLTDPASGLEEFFVPNKEIVIAQNDEEIAERIEYFLVHPEERDAIAQAGFERTRRDHTYEARLSAVIETALQAKQFSTVTDEAAILATWEAARKRHTLTLGLKLLRAGLVAACTLIWGTKRGPRAARKIVFELSRRVLGARTFAAAGLPGRMFYAES